MLVAEEAVEIRVLRRQGKSIREIARMLEVSRSAVRLYLRAEGLPRYEREARPTVSLEATLVRGATASGFESDLWVYPRVHMHRAAT